MASIPICLLAATLLLPLGQLAAADSAAPQKPFLSQTNLFELGQEGYLSYRIPCLLITDNGTILAITSARRAVSDWADINILMRRSTDGGNTWEPREILATGNKKPADNPVAIWDRQKKAVHFLYQVNYADVFTRISLDHGKTFSPARNITASLAKFREKYPWQVIAPGPGHGIQLANGRLVVPVWLSTNKSHRPSVVATIYSDDHGETWQCGEILPETFLNMNETTAVEAPDGGVILFIRNEDPAYRVALASSPDGATRWTKPALHDDLYTPICFASAIRLGNSPQDQRILFANPDSRTKTSVIRKWGARPRENVSIKLSPDGGKSWPVNKVLEPDRSGYSDLAVAPDGFIYCLYERGTEPGNELNTRYLTIAKFNLEWLTGTPASLPAAASSNK